MSVSVPAAVQKLLSEATMKFAFKEFKSATELLLEVVRQCPGLPHPYRTLGCIYDELGEKGKAFKLFLMAAQLSKGDIATWKHLAHLSLAGRFLVLLGVLFKPVLRWFRRKGRG